jgi:hypothetical protein
MEAHMYSNDLHNAYMYAVEQRKDQMREAAQSRLAREGAQAAKGMKTGWAKTRLLLVIGVFGGLVWFLR